MNSFHAALDRYLTTEPNYGFDCWCEKVDDLIDSALWDKHEALMTEYDGPVNRWLNYLWSKGYTEQEAAAMIEKLLLKR